MGPPGEDVAKAAIIGGSLENDKGDPTDVKQFLRWELRRSHRAPGHRDPEVAVPQGLNVRRRVDAPGCRVYNRLRFFDIESLSPFFSRVSELHAKVAELVDALDLGSSGATRESSSLSFRTS